MSSDAFKGFDQMRTPWQLKSEQWCPSKIFLSGLWLVSNVSAYSHT